MAVLQRVLGERPRHPIDARSDVMMWKTGGWNGAAPPAGARRSKGMNGGSDGFLSTPAETGIAVVCPSGRRQPSDWSMGHPTHVPRDPGFYRSNVWRLRHLAAVPTLVTSRTPITLASRVLPLRRASTASAFGAMVIGR
jgi:hypothetical protein